MTISLSSQNWDDENWVAVFYCFFENIIFNWFPISLKPYFLGKIRNHLFWKCRLLIFKFITLNLKHILIPYCLIISLSTSCLYFYFTYILVTLLSNRIYVYIIIIIKQNYVCSFLLLWLLSHGRSSKIIFLKYPELTYFAWKGPLCHIGATKAQIRLRICAVWSGPSLSTFRITV